MRYLGGDLLSGAAAGDSLARPEPKAGYPFTGLFELRKRHTGALLEGDRMRAMAFVWAVILIGGITYFSIIGLTHH
jgi:hypothetical protein